MQQNNYQNIQSICRTCLENLNNLHHDIFQTPDLKKKLITCTSLTVEIDDGFPTNMCQSCFQKLNEFYKFQQMCIYAMQRCYALISSEKQQEDYTIDLIIEEEKLASPILFLEETKQEQKEREEIEEASDIEPSTPKIAELEIYTDNLLEDILSKENESEKEEERENEENHTTNDASDFESNEKHKEKKHTKPKKIFFVCEICKRRFQREAMLTAHKRVHEGLKAFPCTECEKSFTKLYRLRDHMKTKHEPEGERLVCPENGCGRTYAIQQTLNKHINSIHKNKGLNKRQTSYVCEDCGKVLTSLWTLKNHRYIHTGQELPFECVECHKRYITKHKLKEHMNRHAGIKNYVCPHCGARKTTRTELNTHVNYHTKEKTYPCKYCNQIFNCIGNLRRHVRIVHEGIKGFRCKYCSKSFGKAETRKHHEMTHTGEKPHECKICQQKFIQSVSLHKHMKRHYKASKVIFTALAKTQPSS